MSPSSSRKAIFITGDIMGLDTRKFFSESGAYYIMKPFDIGKLKEHIDHVLAQGICAKRFK